MLFNNEYISGILTTQNSFAQKYGYFEIRAKIPVGTGVWPAFWLLANDGGWPPELDVVEGRGEEPGAVVMTTHWRHPDTQTDRILRGEFYCPDAPSDFHDYGALWERDRITYFIDRKPVADIKVPIGFDDPMYMIINLAMGAKYFQGVGFVDAETPGWSPTRSTGCPSIRSIPNSKSTAAACSSKFSRRPFAKLAGFSALGIATAPREGRGRRA